MYKEIEIKNRVAFLFWLTQLQKKGILLGSVIVLIFSFAMSYYIYVQNLPNYVVLTPETRIKPSPPLNDFYFSDNEVASWVQQTLTSTFSWNFLNWRETFAKMQKSYSKEAAQAFEEGIKETLRQIRASRGTVLANVLQVPRIVKKEEVNGVAVWHLETRISANMEAGTGRANLNLRVEMVVRRADMQHYPQGLLIDWIKMSKAQ